MFRSFNPFDNTLVAEYAPLTDGQLRLTLTRAERAFASWRKTTPAHRADLLRRAAQVLTRRRDELAALITAEMGKTLAREPGRG